MAKDFSFMFYPGDVLRQIHFFSKQQKGCYLEILSCHIENIRFSYDFLMKITKELSDFERTEFFAIFDQDNDGYFVDWVVNSIKKRTDYLLSRGENKKGRKKKKICKSYENHMVNENEKEIVLEKEDVKENKGGVGGYKKIGELITYLKEKAGLKSLDGTEKQNRQYCYHILNKLKKEFPDKDESEGCRLLISQACEDNFHRKNATCMKYIYYNYNKIIKSKQNGTTVSADRLKQQIEERFGNYKIG